MIETELNEKRSYARQRCESLMCAEEPYGLSRYGTREEVAALERPQLTESWKRVVTHAPARVIVMGNCELEPLYERSAGHSARFRAGRWFPAKRTIVLPPRRCAR